MSEEEKPKEEPQEEKEEQPKEEETKEEAQTSPNYALLAGKIIASLPPNFREEAANHPDKNVILDFEANQLWEPYGVERPDWVDDLIEEALADGTLEADQSQHTQEAVKDDVVSDDPKSLDVTSSPQGSAPGDTQNQEWRNMPLGTFIDSAKAFGTIARTLSEALTAQNELSKLTHPPGESTQEGSNPGLDILGNIVKGFAKDPQGVLDKLSLLRSKSRNNSASDSNPDNRGHGSRWPSDSSTF